MYQQATAAINIAENHGFAGMMEMAKIYLGWAQAQNGHGEEALQQMQQSMSAYQIGGDTFRAAHLALYADVCGTMGHVAEGLIAVAEVLSLAQRTDGRYNEAELYRLKGELTLQEFQVSSSKFQISTSPRSKVPGLASQLTDPRTLIPTPQSEAEAYFLKAIQISRQQRAKSWELRATMSLSRPWQTQDKGREAYRMLAKCLRRFTEELNTRDGQDAKALLDALHH